MVRYLVQTKYEDDLVPDAECYSLKTPHEIIDILDMRDCYPSDFEIKVFDVSNFGEVVELELKHDWFEDPLWYEYINPKTKQPVFGGFGTDH